jgi:CheY-like chemotaxis protein
MTDDRRPRILLAEDDAELLELYTRRLRAIGEYTVLTARDGETAWERLDESVDLALLDEQMPGCSGASIARAASDAGLEVAIVIVSGTDQAEDGPWEAFLRKPVSLEDLRSVLETHAS